MSSIVIVRRATRYLKARQLPPLQPVTVNAGDLYQLCDTITELDALGVRLKESGDFKLKIIGGEILAALEK